MAEKRQRWRERGREGEGGMFHFRLMICTAHGPDHEEEDQPTAAGRRTDGRPAGLLEGGSVVRRADGDQNQGVHETAAAARFQIRGGMRHRQNINIIERSPPVLLHGYQHG